LTIHSGQSKIYRFPVIFREAGEVDAVGGSFEVNSDQFNLVCTDDALEAERKPTWWLESGSKVRSRLLHRDSGISVKVLPKPPKMEISFPDLRNQYYTNEPITVNIEVLNKEEEDTEAVLEVRLLGRSRDTLGFTWVGRDLASPMKEGPPPVDGSADDVDLPGHLVGRLAQGAKTNEKIQFTAPSEPADYALEVKVLYHLLSDRDIPISKTMITDLIFNAPFEASYDINPRVHPDDWPSYFKLDEIEDADGTVAQGIAQKWALRAKIASFAAETLVVKDLDIDTHAIHGGATCDITKEFSVEDISMNPEELIERSFNLDCRKLNLEERRATALDLSLSITWQRSGSPSNPTVSSSLVIPHINFPSSEPRVLASALRSASVPGLIHMDYYIENPTLHLLTFELNMEASEEFGFSGPKLRNLQVLPMSRQSVRYNLLPLVKGAWISPQLRVVDRYFNKSLKVIATEGLRTDKKGVGVWVHDEGEEEK
jgi:solute carrier family 25 protein 38